MPPTPAEEAEKRDYNDLVAEGGRPLYPIDLVDEIAKDPFSHWDMLRPWARYPPGCDPDPDADSGVNWPVFGMQLRSWREFRYWQKFNRDDYAGSGYGWHDAKAAYDRFVLVFRRRYPSYTVAAKKLLAEYGFTRQFQFHEDPIQQDKLTSWIEYLGYECWVHYRYASRVKRMQPKYDAAWKTLVDSGVLRQFETAEYVCNIESASRRQSEVGQAIQAEKSARSAARAVLTSIHNDMNNPQVSRLTSAARMQMIASAKSRIEVADKALASINRRNDLITVFITAVRDYLLVKQDAEGHSTRVRWALGQIPHIEAELNGTGVAEIGPDAFRGSKRRYECDEDDVATHGRMIKKQRRDFGEASPTPGLEDGHGYRGAKPKRSRDCAADDGSPSKRLRRGSDDLGSCNDMSSVADTGSAGHSQESGSAEVRGSDGDERAVRAIERPNLKGSKPSGGPLQRSKSMRNARQPWATTQPLRRSARIAARQGALQIVATRSSAAKSSYGSSHQGMAQAPTPPRTGSQDQQSRYPATKASKQGARGGSWRDKSKVKATSQGRRRSRHGSD